MVGVYRGKAFDFSTQRVARVRWHSPEPRLVALVVPGLGREAVDAHDMLVRWLKRHVSMSTPLTGAAWVIPDAGVRTMVRTLIDVYGGRAFGAPSNAFSTVSDAMRWLRAVYRGDQNLPARK